MYSLLDGINTNRFDGPKFSRLGSLGVTVEVICSKIEMVALESDHANGLDKN